MLKLPKFNIYYLEVFFILIVGLIPLFWYKNGFMALGHDMTYPLAPIDFFRDRLFVWSDRMGSFGSNQTDAIPGIFIHGLQALSYFLTSDLVTSQKLVFIFWFTLPGITMYILLRSLYPKKEDFVVRISGSLFYMLNHYLLQGWIIAEMTKFSVVAAIPIIVLSIISVVYKKKSIIKYVIFLALTTFFLNGGSGIPLWGGAAVVGLTALIISFISSSEPLFKKLRRTTAFLVLAFLFMVLLNFYWVYPYVTSFTQNYTDKVGSAGGDEGAVSWSKDISQNTSFTNLFRLQGIPDWYANTEHPFAKNFFKNPFLIFLSFLFPIIILTGFLKLRNEEEDHIKYKFLFIVLMLVAMPFAAGSHAPGGIFYDLALRHIPGFVMFRTPFYKFGMAFWFAYACLIGIGLKNTAELLRRYLIPRISPPVINICLLTIFIILWAIYNYPAFTGSFFYWSKNFATMVPFPDYILQAKAEIDENKFGTRYLLLPALDEETQVETYDWKYFSLSTIASILSRKPVIINDVILKGSERDYVNGIYDNFYDNGYSSLLGYFGVNKLLVRNDFSTGKNNIYSLSDSTSVVKNNSRYSFNKSLGAWDFYSIENPILMPMVYSPKSLAYIKADVFSAGYISNDLNPAFSEAFIYDDFETPSSSEWKTKDISRYIIEGRCVNCPVPDRELKFMSPRMMPGTTFYGFSQILEERRINAISVPSQKIDYIFGTINKKVGAVNILFSHVDDELVLSVVKEIEVLLQDIKEIYQSLPADEQLRSKDLIYNYLRYFEVINSEWQQRVPDGEIKEELKLFKVNVHNKFVGLDIIPPIYPPVPQDRVYQFDIRERGEYNIKILLSLRSLESQQKLKVNLDGKEVELERVAGDKLLFVAPTMLFEEGSHKVTLSSNLFLPKDIAERLDVSIKANVRDQVCEDVKLGRVNQENIYEIIFDTNIFTLVNSYIAESNDIDPSSGTKTVLLRKRYHSGSEDLYEYTPTRTSNYAVLRFCARGIDPEPTNIRISNLKITERMQDASVLVSSSDFSRNLESPNIDFVALNQGQYLIRVAPASRQFLMVFGSRYENGWKLKAVDNLSAATYFKGEQKEYLDSRVKEYEQQDIHLLSDFVFPQKSDVGIDHLRINGIFNGWKLNPSEGEKFYLIEYEPQNTFYKAVYVTVGTLLVIIALIGYKYYRRLYVHNH